MLKVEKVSKTYAGHQALREVSFDIPEGAIFGLLGPNGAGKTTLLRIINQIIGPDQGQVFFNGELLQPKHISRIGYLPEERGLYPKMKVKEQLLYLSRLKGIPAREARPQINHWLERFKLEKWADQNVESLSKGMAQKVQFIATVLHQPQLLIFDEPFTGFDPVNTNLIKDEIRRLNKEGATVVFSTHRMDSVEELCEKIVLLNQAEVLLQGRVEAIKDENRAGVYRLETSASLEKKSLEQFGERLEEGQEGRHYWYRLKTASEDPAALLRYLAVQGTLRRFEEERPSLNDIFIQKVAT